MNKHAQHFPIGIMATVLGVSKSGYYQFLKAQLSSRSQANQLLIEKIKEIQHLGTSIEKKQEGDEA